MGAFSQPRPTASQESPLTENARLEIRALAYDHPDAVTLVDRVQQIYTELYGQADPDPSEAAMYVPPGGAFYVGYLGRTPVATGAWRTAGLHRLGTHATAEVKRMFVVPEAQRRGLARRMLAHLERTAAAAGFAALVLSTGPLQPEAIALYRSAGYEPVAPFGYFADHPDVVCLGKRIDPGGYATT